jgi:hypothetical protein
VKEKYFCPKCSAEVHIAPKWMVYGESIPADRLSTTEWYCRDCNEYWEYPVKKNIDTKALDLACRELSGFDCPPIGVENCKTRTLLFKGNERKEICTACTVQYYRQKAGEK